MSDNAIVQEIKDKLDIVDVIEGYGYPLKKVGNEYRGAISSSSKSGMSLCVNRDKQVYDDKAGTAGNGDVLTFIAWKEGLDIGSDFPQVLRIAADKAGVVLEQNIDSTYYAEKSELQRLNRWVCGYYHSCLTEEIRELIRSKWGITDQTMDCLLIGWAPGDCHLLQVQEIKDYFSTEILKKSGLFYCNNNDKLVDIYRGRIVFPYWRHGSIVYSIGRDPKWDKDKNQRKFIKQLVHSDDRPYVSRAVENVLWGLDSIKGKDTVYITEGIADAIVLLQNGLPVISPVTTRIKAADVEQVVSACKGKKVVKIINDNETNDSGLNGAKDTAKALEAAGISASIVQLPREEGLDKIDIAEYMLSHSREDLEGLHGCRVWDVILDTILCNVDISGSTLTKTGRAKADFLELTQLPASERKLGTKEIWKAYGLELKVFEDAYNEVFLEIEKENKTKPQKEEEPIENDVLDIYTDEVKGYAIDILKNGDPFAFILEVVNKYHVGDENTKKLGLVSFGSCNLTSSSGVQLKPSGPSGKGKTHVLDNIATVVPSHRVFRGSMSGMAAYYNEKTLKDGMIFLLDDTDLNRTEGLKNTIKRASSNFQNRTKHITVVKGRGKEVEIPARVLWWLSSVRGVDDDQLGNRFIPINIDSTKEQDQRVYDWQKNQHLYGSNPDKDLDVQVCRCIYDILGKETYEIVVPFVDAIEWNNKDNRRNFPMFLDIVMGVAFHYIKQRECVNGVYWATVEDCEKAIEIYGQIEEQNASNLTEEETDLISWMGDQFRAGSWVDRNAIQKYINRSNKHTRDLLHGEDANGGLLAKVPHLEYEKRQERNETNACEKTFYRMTVPYHKYGEIVRLKKEAVDDAIKNYSHSRGTSSTSTAQVLKKTSAFSRSAATHTQALVVNSSLVIEEIKDTISNVNSSADPFDDVCVNLDIESEQGFGTSAHRITPRDDEKALVLTGTSAAHMRTVPQDRDSNKESHTEELKNIVGSAVPDVSGWIDDWEKSNGPIYGKKAIQAAQEISKAHRIHPTEYSIVEAAVKKRAAGRCVDCGSEDTHHETKGEGRRCNACHKKYSNPPAVVVPDEFSLEPAGVTQ